MKNLFLCSLMFLFCFSFSCSDITVDCEDDTSKQSTFDSCKTFCEDANCTQAEWNSGDEQCECSD